MAIQFLRGLEADRLSITPTPGQPLIAKQLDNSWKLYIGDGFTPGGVLLTSGGGSGGTISVLSDVGDVPVPDANSFLQRNATNDGYDWVNTMFADVDGGTFADPILSVDAAQAAGVSIGMVLALGK